jgi:DNA-binding response OmpR family regulator
MKILIIEDEKELSVKELFYLKEESYVCEIAWIWKAHRERIFLIMIVFIRYQFARGQWFKYFKRA